MSAGPVLEVRAAHFAYPGGAPVLRGVSLRVPAGTVAAVLGPNGVGKSTLLDLCLGWRAPARGSVLLDGRPASALGRGERGRLVSLVPQRENVRFDFQVLDYVLLGRAPHLAALAQPGPADTAVAERALAAAGIPGLAGRSITTLSGGEYQLMLIARSLAQEPAVLLLDEPASHLDPRHQRDVVRVLRRLAGRGTAVLFTTHSPQLAAAAADTVHLLRAGRVLASGTPRAALTAGALGRVYGVPFTVRWTRGRFACTFEAGESP
jgi:iron complex transport system ATP-binding protein